MSSQSTVAPGYCVVQQPGTLDFQARLLFNNANSEAARYFMQINKDTPWVKPGQILIVADPANSNQAYQLNHLIAAKQKVNAAMTITDNSVADFLNRNYENIAALTSWGDKLVGNASEAGEKYFKRIETLLIKIEQTYQNQFRTQGALIGQQFYAERNALFAELKPLLNKISRMALKIKAYESIKKALGLSTRSIVHEWSTVGVGAIPGYSSYISRSAKAASYMKAGGWVSLGFSFMSTSNDVYHACTTGRENECGKVVIKEYSKFGGGAAGAAFGGTFAVAQTAAICAALGVPTAGTGTLVCGIVVGFASTAGGAWLGTKAGEAIGDELNTLIFQGD